MEKIYLQEADINYDNIETPEADSDYQIDKSRTDLAATYVVDKIFSDIKNSIEPIRELLAETIPNYGDKINTNPFFKFVDIYYRTKGNKQKILSDEDFKTIISLLGEGVIDQKDLKGESADKLNHILFNNHLYENNAEDTKFIVQAYDFLGQPDLIKKHLTNYDLLKKTYNLNVVKNSISEEQCRELRNSIIYKNPKALDGSLNDINTIERSIKDLESRSHQKQDIRDPKVDKALTDLKTVVKDKDAAEQVIQSLKDLFGIK